MKKITIIVPCYNEEASLNLFYDEIVKWINYEQYQMDLMFVNDGSRDKTLEILRELSKKDERVHYISLSRNFGKESAMHAGLERCKDCDAIIMMDADLQHPPHLIPQMIKYWEEGYNLIYTTFKTRKGEPLLKRFFARCFYKLFDMTSDIHLDNGAKDYQLLDKKVVNAFMQLPDNNRFMKGIFSWVGYKKICIPFEYVDRQAGKTTWNFKKLFKYGWNGVNQFSNILSILPSIMMFLIFGVFVTETVFFFMDKITLFTYLTQAKIDVFAFMIMFIFKAMFYLMYNMRRQIMNRPIYLVEETEQDEKH